MKTFVNTALLFALITILVHFFVDALPFWAHFGTLLVSFGAARILEPGAA